MNQSILARICDEVYRRFPQVAGSSPKVQRRPDESVLLIFTGKARAADGRAIAHTVRVVASPEGKILKTSTSR